MDREVLGVLLSGQLLLVVWQVIKEVSDRREKKRARLEASNHTTIEIKSLVFKLYRDNLRRKIISVDNKVENPTLNIKAELMDLHDDAVLYFDCGGNGLVKQLYGHLCDKVRSQLGEEYFVLLCIEDSGAHHDI